MKSSVVNRMGPRVTRTSSILGSNVSSTNVTSHYTQLWVNSDVTAGNRRDPNPFSMVKRISGQSWTSSISKETAYGKPSYTNTYGPWMGTGYASSSSVLNPDFGETRDNAMEKIFNQLRGNSNLIVDLAEGGQTLKMLKSVTSLKKLFTEFMINVVKQRKYKRIPKGPTQGQRRLDYVTGKWLEYRYGWMPLLNSIYDAADTYKRKLENLRVSVKARSSKRFTIPRTRVGTGTGTVANPFAERIDHVFSYRTEFAMQFRVPIVNRLRDWTSLNPLGIAWELTPLSFVGDWLVNVSQFLSNWENYFLFSSDFLKGYRTEGVLEEYTYHEWGKVDVPFVVTNNVWTSGELTFLDRGFSTRLTQKERVVLTSLPTPSGLRLRVNLNAKRMLDASALFHQLIGSSMRDVGAGYKIRGGSFRL